MVHAYRAGHQSDPLDLGRASPELRRHEVVGDEGHLGLRAHRGRPAARDRGLVVGESQARAEDDDQFSRHHRVVRRDQREGLVPAAQGRARCPQGQEIRGFRPLVDVGRRRIVLGQHRPLGGVGDPIPLLAGFAGLQDHHGRRVAVFQETVLAVGLDFDARSGRDLEAVRDVVAVGSEGACHDLHPDRADYREDASGHFGVADAGVDRPHEDVAHDEQRPVGIPGVFLGEGIAVTAVAHGDRHRVARGRLAFEIEIRARREEPHRAGRGDDVGIADAVIGAVDPRDERVAHLLGTLVAG